LKRTGFRIMRREMAEAISRSEEAHASINLTLVRRASQVGNVDVDHHTRPYGKSGYTWAKLLKMALDGVLAAKKVPPVSTRQELQGPRRYLVRCIVGRAVPEFVSPSQSRGTSREMADKTRD
jgi:hypothetical protein